MEINNIDNFDELLANTAIDEKIKEYKSSGKNLKTYVHWNNSLLEKWIYELLFKAGAVSNTGIVSDYPCMLVERIDDGTRQYNDFKGNVQQINEAVESFNKNDNRNGKYKCYLYYYPKTYFTYKNVLKKINDSYVNKMTEEEKLLGINKLRKILVTKKIIKDMVC
jgi:hypothetical protein